jgi:hypothetical protein
VSKACGHASAIAEVDPPAPSCAICVAGRSRWVNLRQCLACGVTLCCDASPSKHMTRHWQTTGHAVMRNAMPGVAWTWCFPDKATIRSTEAGWQTYDAFVETGLIFAARHVESGGDLRAEGDLLSPEGFPIGEWVASMRERHAGGTLDPDDVTSIEGLPGWSWEASAGNP